MTLVKSAPKKSFSKKKVVLKTAACSCALDWLEVVAFLYKEAF
jgi:hypothetical protein